MIFFLFNNLEMFNFLNEECWLQCGALQDSIRYINCFMIYCFIVQCTYFEGDCLKAFCQYCALCVCLLRVGIVDYIDEKYSGNGMKTFLMSVEMKLGDSELE